MNTKHELKPSFNLSENEREVFFPKLCNFFPHLLQVQHVYIYMCLRASGISPEIRRVVKVIEILCSRY